MVAKTRSQTKHENERKKPVFDLLKFMDSVMAFFGAEFDSSVLDIDLADLSLALTAMPLPEEERKKLIDHAQFYV